MKTEEEKQADLMRRYDRRKVGKKAFEVKHKAPLKKGMEWCELCGKNWCYCSYKT